MKETKAVHNRLVMEWVLEKVKFMMPPKMQVIKYSSSSKFKAIKINKKYNKIQTNKINKTKKTLRWKVNFKVKCMISKSPNRVRTNSNKDNKFQTNKWVRLITKNANKILRTNRAKLKERAMLMQIYKDKNKGSNSQLTTRDKKINKKEKDNKIDKMTSKTRNNSNEVIGMIIISKARKLINNTNKQSNTKETLITWLTPNSPNKYLIRTKLNLQVKINKRIRINNKMTTIVYNKSSNNHKFPNPKNKIKKDLNIKTNKYKYKIQINQTQSLNNKDKNKKINRNKKNKPKTKKNIKEHTGGKIISSKIIIQLISSTKLWMNNKIWAKANKMHKVQDRDKKGLGNLFIL